MTLERLFSDLVRLQTELWNSVDIELKATHDLPLAWYEPMKVISEIASCRVADIADSLSISVGGVSKLVDRIERAGFCIRIPHPGDGRSSTLDLTTKGRALLGKASKTVQAEISKRVSGVVSSKDLTDYSNTTRFLLNSIKATRAVKS